MATQFSVLNNPTVADGTEAPFIRWDNRDHALRFGKVKEKLPRLDGTADDRPIRKYGIFRELWMGDKVQGSGPNAEQAAMCERIKIPKGDDHCMLLFRVPSFQHMTWGEVRVSCGAVHEKAAGGLKFDVIIVKKSDPTTPVHTIASGVDGLTADSHPLYFPWDNTTYTLEGEDEYLVYIKFTELPYLVDGEMCFKDPCLDGTCMCVQIRLHCEGTCNGFETLSDDFKCCPEEEPCDPCDPDCNCPEEEEEPPKPVPATTPEEEEAKDGEE